MCAQGKEERTVRELKDGAADRTAMLQKQKSRSRRMVRWASKALLRFTEKTESQRRQSWYDDADYKSFKRDCKETIKVAQTVDDPEVLEASEEFCVRGLETMGVCKETKATRRQRREEALDAVWNEQLSQLENEARLSDEEIAKVYKDVSSKSLEDAQKRALKYSEENKREEEKSRRLAKFGKKARAALRTIGGSFRGLGKKSQAPSSGVARIA